MVIFKESYTSNDFYYYFFATHFPEYLLGLILYYDFIENKLTKNAYKLMILGLSVLVVAVIIFYLYPRSISQVLSAWITGIATYFILYFLLSNEKQKETFSVTALVTIGRSSYYIYLLNAFFTFTFTKVALRILGEMGVASDWSFVVLLPVVILLSVEAGLLMQKTVRLILPVLRKIYTAAS
jgi:peptidoglycan/LPS O-acetylase OafA/YrhL